MAKVYRPYFPEQDFLLPPSLREWLPEDHLSYFVSDLIDQLDLSQIEQHYEREERGYPPYHPRMMTKVCTAIAWAFSRRGGGRSGCLKTSLYASWRTAMSPTSARSRSVSRVP